MRVTRRTALIQQITSVSLMHGSSQVPFPRAGKHKLPPQAQALHSNLRGNLKWDGFVCVFEHRHVISRLWNIHLPQFCSSLRHILSPSSSKLLPSAAVTQQCVCNSMPHPPSILQPIQRDFLSFCGERVRQSMCGCQISIFLPAILGMLLKNLAIGFFTEWCSNLCLQICQNITNNAATKGCYLINVSEIKMQLPCIKSRLQAECRSLPHFHFSSAHVSDLLNMFCPKWAGFW